MKETRTFTVQIERRRNYYVSISHVANDEFASLIIKGQDMAELRITQENFDELRDMFNSLRYRLTWPEQEPEPEPEPLPIIGETDPAIVFSVPVEKFSVGDCVNTDDGQSARVVEVLDGDNYRVDLLDKYAVENGNDGSSGILDDYHASQLTLAVGE